MDLSFLRSIFFLGGLALLIIGMWNGRDGEWNVTWNPRERHRQPGMRRSIRVPMDLGQLLWVAAAVVSVIELARAL